jgi:hypothetical protein
MSNYSRRVARLSASAVAMLAVAGLLAAVNPVRPATTSTRLTAKQMAVARESRSCWVKAPVEWIGSAYLIGYSNATKEGESTLVGPGLKGHPKAALQGLHGWYELANSCNGLSYVYVTGTLDYRNLPQMPPFRATFLAYGFEPVTATFQLAELPVPCHDVLGHQVAPPPVYTCLATKNFPDNTYVVTAKTQVEARIENVTVNGTPLQVGSACRTSRPFALTLTGNSKTGYSVIGGGALLGKFTIGPFTGCGVMENLDPLLDSAVSDAQNPTKITQGPTCADFINPPIGLNANCLVPPGPGHPWGIPKYLPVPIR